MRSSPAVDVRLARPGPHLGVDGFQLLEVRRVRHAEALDGLSTSRAMPGNERLPARKRSTATSSAAMSAAVAPGPARPAARASGRAGKRASSGASKVMLAWLTRVQAGRRAGSALGMVEGVLDGDAHVGEPKLGLLGAVHELDERVDEALGVDDDVDVLVAAHRRASAPR